MSDGKFFHIICGRFLVVYWGGTFMEGRELKYSFEPIFLEISFNFPAQKFLMKPRQQKFSFNGKFIV